MRLYNLMAIFSTATLLFSALPAQATAPAITYKVLGTAYPAPGDTATIWYTTDVGANNLGNAFTTITIHDKKNNVVDQQVVSLGNLNAHFSQTLSATYTIPKNFVPGTAYSIDFSTWAQTGYSYDPPQTNLYTFTIASWPHNNSLPSMHLTLNDEFTGGKLNRAIWSPFYAHPLSMPITYEFFLPDEVQMLPAGGVRLRSDKRSYLGRTYASSALTSIAGFVQTYGHFEMKAKIPKGQGLWPAFWLLPTDTSWPPEVDVFENLGGDTTTMYHTNHWLFGQNNQNQSKQGISHNVDLSAAYHVYAIDWRPNLLIWSIDGVETFRTVQDVPSQPMYILADLAVGSSDWGGPPNAATPFPAEMDIAYIKAYQFDDMPAENPDWITVDKTVMSSEKLVPGQTVTITSGVKVGNNWDASNVAVTVSIMDILNQQVFHSQVVSLGNLKKGSSTPISVTYTVPKTMAAGYYDVRILATSPAFPNRTRGLYTADRFTVGTPLPPPQ